MNNIDNSNFDDGLAEAIAECRKNLKDILDEQSVVEWARQLGVSKSIITSRWKKDHFPNIPNIIKILLLSRYSANWLLLGIGPKYIGDVYDSEQSESDELRRREVTAALFKLENQVSEEKNKLKALEQYIYAHQGAETLLANTDIGDILFKPSKKINAATSKSLFKSFFLPLMTLLQSMNQIGFKLIEAIADSDESGDKLERIIESIQSNLEKNQFSLQSSLADLERLFDKAALMNLLSSSVDD